MIINHDNRMQRFFAVLILLLGLISLTGCWSSQEANNLAVINIMGIDKNESGQFELTALIVKPQNQSMSSIEDNGKSQNLIETGKGRSLLEAMSQLSTSISKKIYLGHMQVVVIGDKAARESMKESLDFLRREYDFRPNIKLLVTQGKAGDIVQIPAQLKTPLGSEIQNSIRVKKLSPTNMVLNLSQFAAAFAAEMKDPYTGEISAAQENGIQVEQAVLEMNQRKAENHQEVFKSETNGNQKSNVFGIYGTAVFKKENLIGYLNKRETRGLLWINGKLNNDVVVLKCPRNDRGTVSVQIKKTTSQLSPRMMNGKPEMDAFIKVNGDIGQVTCQNVSLNSGELEAMNQQLKGIVMQDIKQTFAKAKQEWQTDIFNFGESIYRKYPQDWKIISPTWRNGGLMEMPVQLKVTANIERYGLSGG